MQKDGSAFFESAAYGLGSYAQGLVPYAFCRVSLTPKPLLDVAEPQGEHADAQTDIF